MVGNVNNSEGDMLRKESLEEENVALNAEKVKEHDVIDEEIKQAKALKEDLDNELKENGGWVKILGNEQIMKKVLVEGVSNTRPLRGEICTIKYVARVIGEEDYKELDENSGVIFEENDNFTFQLGDAEVITGLDLGIPLMCKGERSLIRVSPRFAYGSLGNPPSISSSSSLLYIVHLVSFEQEKDLEELSVGERKEIGGRKRERGNWWYGRGEAALAIQCYRRALEFLDDPKADGITYAASTDTSEIDEEERELVEDRLKTYNNMAAAQLKLQAYTPALKSVENVLRCQPQNVKALFRKGKILAEKGDTVEALQVFKLAISIEPDNKAVILEISKLSQKRKEERENESLLYKRMFNTSSSQKSSSSPTSDSFFSLNKSINVALLAGGAVMAVAGVMAYRYTS